MRNLKKCGPPLWTVALVVVLLLAGLTALALETGPAGLITLGVIMGLTAVAAYFAPTRMNVAYWADPYKDWKEYRMVTWGHLLRMFMAAGAAILLTLLVINYGRPGSFYYMGGKITIFSVSAIAFAFYAAKEIRLMPLRWRTPAWGDLPGGEGPDGLTPEERRKQICLIWNADFPDRIMREAVTQRKGSK